MFYNTDLEELIFTQHSDIDSDELIIISGYLGPSPIERLTTLDLPATVVYGMYPSDGIGERLHTTLNSIHNRNESVDILYSSFQVHAKCYIWKKEGEIIHALIGSANFSSNGLRTPFREVLTIANEHTYESLNEYAEMIINRANICTSVDLTNRNQGRRNNRAILQDTTYCRMTLLIPNTGQVHEASGINWGQNPNNHTNPRDASIPIRTTHIREFPTLFPPKLESPTNVIGGREQRENDAIDIVWDDGTTMEGLLEGSQPVDGIKHPKQICSFPNKFIMGDYLRSRMGIASGEFVSTEDLVNYGRTHIDVSIIGEGVYYLDFSVPIQNVDIII